MEEEVREIDGDVAKVLLWAAEERAAIKAETDKLEARARAVNSVAMRLMATNGLKNFESEVGVLTLKMGGVRKSLNRQTLITKMLGSGLNADRVNEILDAATDMRPCADSLMFKGV